MDVGKNVRKYRIRNRYSLDGLSRVSGIGYKVLSKIENEQGRDITHKTAMKLKTALGITLDQLYEE